jgi:hypothetical protein
MSIAQERLGNGDVAVIANRGEETGPMGEQIAWLVSKERESVRMMGKQSIALTIADFLESIE